MVTRCCWPPESSAGRWLARSVRPTRASTSSARLRASPVVGSGFALLIVAAKLSANGVRVAPYWLVVTYLLHTFGELSLSPVGLSATTKLAPARVAGLMMGLWFLSTGVAELLAGQIAAITDKVGRGELFHLFGGQADPTDAAGR